MFGAEQSLILGRVWPVFSRAARVHVLAASLAAVFVSVPSWAASGDRLAVFPVVASLRSTEDLVRSLQDTLVQRATKAGIPVLTGSALRKLVKDPQQAIKRCRDDVACVVKLGRKAKVHRVLVGSATPLKRGFRASFMMINVTTGHVMQRARFDVLKLEQVDAVISAHFKDLFGQEDPNDTELVMPALEELTTVAAAPASQDDEDAPPDTELGLEPLDGRPSDTPGADSSPEYLTASPETGGAATPITGRPVAPAESSGALFYGGLVALGVGVVGGGVATALGIMREDAASRAAPRDVPQKDHEALIKQAMALQEGALLTAGVAGGIALVGGVLVLLDFLLGQPTTAETSVSIGAQGIRF